MGNEVLYLTDLMNTICDLYNNRGRLTNHEHQRLVKLVEDADNLIGTLMNTDSSSSTQYRFPMGNDGYIVPGDIVYSEECIPWAVTSVGLGEYPVHAHTIHKPYQHRHLKASCLCHTMDLTCLADAMVGYANSLETGDTKSAILRWAELINEHEDSNKKNPMF